MLSIPGFPRTALKSYRLLSRSLTPNPESGNIHEDIRNGIEQLQDFWKGNKNKTPYLSSIAQNFGFVLSSSATFERSLLFSNILR